MNVPVASISKLQSPQAHGAHKSWGQQGSLMLHVLVQLDQGHLSDHALQPSLTHRWQPPLNTQHMITDFLNHLHIAPPNFTETVPKQGTNLAIHLPVELEPGLRPTGRRCTGVDRLTGCCGLTEDYSSCLRFNGFKTEEGKSWCFPSFHFLTENSPKINEDASLLS